MSRTNLTINANFGSLYAGDYTAEKRSFRLGTQPWVTLPVTTATTATTATTDVIEFAAQGSDGTIRSETLRRFRFPTTIPAGKTITVIIAGDAGEDDDHGTMYVNFETGGGLPSEVTVS